MQILPLAIHADSVVLDGAAYVPEGRHARTIVLCHGLPKGLPAPENGDDPGYSGLARQFVQRGYGAVIFNFRGTGKSGGSLEVARWPDDLRAVLDHLQSDARLFRDRYGVVGFSTGGSAAICAAAADARIDPLITCAAPAEFDFLHVEGSEQAYFDHYKNVGMIRPEYDKTAAQWAQNFEKLQAGACMAQVKARRICLIHGADDDTVPIEHAHRLAAAAPVRVSPTVLPGVGHHLRREPKVLDALFDYLADA